MKTSLFRIEVRAAGVARNHISPLPSRNLEGCKAGHHCQSLQWRGGCVQGVAPPHVELAAHQPEIIVPVSGVCPGKDVKSMIEFSKDRPFNDVRYHLHFNTL